MAEDNTPPNPASPASTQTTTAGGQTVTVRVRYDTTEVAYASQFIVSAGAEEIVVGISPGFVTDPNSRENLLPIHSRIAMTPGGARRLMQALGNALSGIENAANNAGSGSGTVASAGGATATVGEREAGLPKLDS